MKNNNKGFSLVELIVVIAIMAILAAVAVVGVSVYIPKAQQANDKQMIADIQYAISLYTSAETLTPGESGFVVVHKNGGVSVGGSLDAAPDQLITNALKATFGENYANELKVTYPKWTGTLTGDDLANISDSSYIENTDDLLDKIQLLTNSLKEFGQDQETANRATLEVAEATVAMSDEQKAQFIEWWVEDFSPISSNIADLNLVSSLAASYARLESFVLYAQSCGCLDRVEDGNQVKGINTVFTEASSKLAADEASGGAFAALNNTFSAVMTHVQGCSVCSANRVDANYIANQAEIDANAYLALMGQVNNMSDDILANSDITSSDFYTSDYVTNAINGYTGSVQAYENANAEDGDIVVVVLVGQDGNITYKVYPLDYQ